MTGAAKIFLVASILYPGESVVEEHARVEVIPSTMAECAKQMRLAGNMLERGGPLQVIFSCIDESISPDGGGVWGRAGYSLEKEKPGGGAGKRKGWGKRKR